VLSMRRMFHRCKLVHADLSEYNILYHDAHLYVIDVSQSVEHDHPHAFDFLRNDIKNIEEFFGRYGVNGLGVRRCFEFITRDRLEEDSEAEEHNDGQVLQRWIAEAGGSEEDHPREAAEVDRTGNAEQQTAHEDNVFLKSYIPRTLNEVYDPERDIDVLRGGDGKKLIYANTIGLVDASAGGVDEHHVHFDGSASSSGSGDSECSSDEQTEEEQAGSERRAPRGHRHEDREAKKERKKTVKAEAREKRKNKMSKAEKKRRIKNTRP